MDQVRCRRPRDSSLLHKLSVRRANGKIKQAELWAEDESVFHQRLEYLELSAGTTRSTIALAFSADGRFFASTHGDHTVKITDFSRSKVVQTLRGHPRTPWTVKFHPKDSRIVASGCLAFEVRVWNMPTGRCLHVVKLKAAIISISFHPSGNVLAIASGQCVYLWNYNNKPSPQEEWRHAHILRCVRFTPDGAGLIVGAANNGATTDQSHISVEVAGAAVAREVQAEVTFRLQVWDFNLEAILTGSGDPVMTRPRKLLEKTLLYNDGGFDLSPDGLWLCAIAKLKKVASDPPLAVWSSATVSVAAMRYGVDATMAVKPSSSLASKCVKGDMASRFGMHLAGTEALEVKRGGAELPVSADKGVERAGDAGERWVERAKGGGGPLAPWPSRDRSNCRFGGVSNLIKCAGASGRSLLAASSKGIVAQAGGREAPPHTPSPRIKLKRRRSGSLVSTVGGSSGDRSSGCGLSWNSEGQKTPVSRSINSSPRDRRRARLGDKESGNGAEQVLSRSEIPGALSGELRISLPLLIPPPAASSFAQPPDAVVDHPVHNLRHTAAEAPGETSQQHRRPEEESQLFFLQAPPDPDGGAVGGSPEAPSAGEGREGTIRRRMGGGIANGGERNNRSGRRVGGRRGGSCCLRGESRTGPPWQGQSSEDLMPHLVLVSLHPGPEEGGREESRVIRAAAMEAVAAKQVTSVKLSPSMRYILLGAGARVGQSGSQQSLRPTQEGSASNGIERASNPEHTVTSIYRASDLLPANFMPTVDDDVNIACFHPEPGMGCVYGTKQGRVCLVRVADR